MRKALMSLEETELQEENDPVNDRGVTDALYGLIEIGGLVAVLFFGAIAWGLW